MGKEVVSKQTEAQESRAEVAAAQAPTSDARSDVQHREIDSRSQLQPVAPPSGQVLNSSALTSAQPRASDPQTASETQLAAITKPPVPDGLVARSQPPATPAAKGTKSSQ